MVILLKYDLCNTLLDPGPIARMFWEADREEQLELEIQLDGVITIVDGINAGRYWKESQEYEKSMKILNSVNHNAQHEFICQIASADRIIINKMDKATEEDVGRLENNIKSVNPLAKIIRSTRSVVDLDFILNIGAYNMNIETLFTKFSFQHYPDQVLEAIIFNIFRPSLRVP